MDRQKIIAYLIENYDAVLNTDGTLFVADVIYFGSTPITTLSDNIVFMGNVNFENSQIRTLPKNAVFSCSVFADRSCLQSNEFWVISNVIGSRQAKTLYNREYDKIYCGCFKGSLVEFKKRVTQIYPNADDKHRIEYGAFIKECEVVMFS